MNISQLVNNSVNAHANNLPKTASQKTQDKPTTLATDNVDKFDTNSVNVNRNYQHGTERAEHLNVQGYKGKSALQIKNGLMADYVNFTMGNQSGNSLSDIFKNNSFISSLYNPKSFAIAAFNAAEATSEKHADYWGVEAVAERIFTFAKTLAGDNDELFATMKNAFLKGFNLASGARKGSLPDISYQTKSKVLELFDEWEAEINAKKNPPPAESEK